MHIKATYRKKRLCPHWAIIDTIRHTCHVNKIWHWDPFGSNIVVTLGLTLTLLPAAEISISLPHSLTPSLPILLTHSFIHSLTHSLTHSFLLISIH